MTEVLLAQIGTGSALMTGSIFVVVFAAAAYIMFRLLRKTVKIAFRMAIVAAIVIAAAVGSLTLWWLKSDSAPKPRTPASRPK